MKKYQQTPTKNQYKTIKTIHSSNNTILTTLQINQISKNFTPINKNIIITPNQNQQARGFA